MRTIKIVLIIVLILVTALFAVTGIREMRSNERFGPTLTCDSDLLEVSVTATDADLLAGVTAWDDQDGDLTDKIYIQGISKLVDTDTTRITYIVFDRHGNMASASRLLHYTDYESPRFYVTEPLQYMDGAAIALMDRIRIMDALEGDITHMVRVSALNSTAEPEIFNVDLQATNALGDTARITLPVVIYSGSSGRPEVRLREYLVYQEVGSSFVPERYIQEVTAKNEEFTPEDVEINGWVNTAVPGVYTVTYRCTGQLGVGIAVLTVVVEEGGSHE